MAKKPQAGTIELPPLQIERIDVPIIGDGALICHAWSKKVREEMLAKQMKKASTGRAAKDPDQDFFESLYWLDGMPAAPTFDDVMTARFGFPSIAFKAAAITAVTTIGSLTKVAARQAFHIDSEFVQLLGPPPAQRIAVSGGNSKRFGFPKPVYFPPACSRLSRANESAAATASIPSRSSGIAWTSRR